MEYVMVHNLDKDNYPKEELIKITQFLIDLEREVKLLRIEVEALRKLVIK